MWLVCSILGGGHRPLVLLAYRCWRWGEEDSEGDSQVYPAYVCGKEQKTCVNGKSGCVLIPIWGILSGTYVWLGLNQGSRVRAWSHDDDNSTSATRIIVSLLEPIL